MSEQTQESTAKERVTGLFNNQAQREKYWTELTDSEKLERMRQVVRSMKVGVEEALNLLNKCLNDLEHQYQNHFHSGNDLAYKQSFSHGQGVMGAFDRDSVRSFKQSDQDLFF